MKRLCILVLLMCHCVAGAEELTYIDIISRLTDLQRLAELPRPGEKCSQFSSYNRESRYDTSSGKYVLWDYNDDGAGFVRKEGDKLVLAEMEGPGVIWRIWTAWADKGNVTIYMDDNPDPVVDMPFTDYFNLKNEPFTRAALVHTTARGQNSYIPLPFQKSCKIVGNTEPIWGNYYHFTWSKFPPDTKLPTFTRKLTEEESKALDNANEILGNCGADPAGPREGQTTEIKEVTAAAGQKMPIAELTGPRAITALKVRVELPVAPGAADILRQLTLGIYWDNDTELSVWTPLGDFFGTAPGINKYESLPMGMTDEGFYSFWYMPFEKGALLELTNDGAEERKVTFEITTAPLTQSISHLGRFHAKWHRDVFGPQEPERAIDWTILKTIGRGRFCGVSLHVWNPAGGWWGEGDEKFFVDGEKFPSTYGTGSEDYFGYAWCTPEYFQSAYHNQPLNNGNIGHVSNNRWHIVDNVPFATGFEAAIEKYYPNSKPTLYAAVSYWYLSSDGIDAYEVVSPSERLGYYVYPTAAPTTEIPDGIFMDAAQVELACATKGASIHYTLDGSEPSESSTLYTGPIVICEPVTINARAFKKGHVPSPTAIIKRRKVTVFRDPDNPSQTSPGLKFGYYEGTWKNVPNFRKETPVCSGVCEKFKLQPDTKDTNFGLVYEGYVEVPADDIYTFYCASDDGSQLYIGGHKLIDQHRRQGINEAAGQLALKAGKHEIALLYIQQEGPKTLKLSYASPNIEKTEIPASALSH